LELYTILVYGENKMGLIDKIFLILIGAFFCLIILMTISTPFEIIAYYELADNFQSELELHNVKVVSGTIDSPSVIIDVDSVVFIGLLENSSVVYRQFGCFYVLKENNTIGYKYTPPQYFLGIIKE
jgi:hypothetical protein